MRRWEIMASIAIFLFVLLCLLSTFKVNSEELNTRTDSSRTIEFRQRIPKTRFEELLSQEMTSTTEEPLRPKRFYMSHVLGCVENYYKCKGFCTICYRGKGNYGKKCKDDNQNGVCDEEEDKEEKATTDDDYDEEDEVKAQDDDYDEDDEEKAQVDDDYDETDEALPQDPITNSTTSTTTEYSNVSYTEAPISRPIEVTYHLYEEYLIPQQQPQRELSRRNVPIVVQTMPQISFTSHIYHHPSMPAGNPYKHLYPISDHHHPGKHQQIYQPKPLYYDDVTRPIPPPTTHIVNDYADHVKSFYDQPQQAHFPGYEYQGSLSPAQYQPLALKYHMLHQSYPPSYKSQHKMYAPAPTPASYRDTVAYVPGPPYQHSIKDQAEPTLKEPVVPKKKPEKLSISSMMKRIFG